MKKIISALIVAACLFMVVPAQAQLRWGVKVGMNLNNASIKGLGDNFKAENRAGFFVGPMLDFSIPLGGLGVDASLLYSQRNTDVTYQSKGTLTETKTNRQHAIDIPINLKYSIGMGDMASVFVFAGPDFSFNVKSDNILEQIGDLSGEDFSIGNAAKKADIGLNVGLGVKLINHLQIAANYNIPFGDSAEESFKNGEIPSFIKGNVFKKQNKIWQVSLAYMF